MEATEQVTLQFRVVSCAELPRTNFIGSIDPYVRVFFDDQVLGETRHLKKQQGPVWEEDFFFDVNRNEDGYLCGVVRLELYDDNRTRQDELVASAEVDLSELPPESVDPHGQQQIQFYDHSWSYQSDKRGEKLSKQGLNPRVTVAFLGTIPSWSSLLARLEGYEEEMGLLADEDSHQLYVPIPDGEAAGLYGGVQYLLPRAVHFKLVTTCKQPAGLQLDFRCSKARCLQVERCTYHGKRRRLLRGLRVSAEATLTNLPLSTDLSKLHLMVTNRRAVMSCSVAEVLETAGFPSNPFGANLSYKRIAKDMVAATPGDSTLETHDADPCILLSVGKPPHQAVLQLDYREGGGPNNGVGAGGGGSGGDGGSGRRGGFLSGGGGGGLPRPVLRVLTMKGSTQAQGRQLLHDFLTTGVQTTTTLSDVHRRPLKILDGKFEVARSSELPGTFDEDKVNVYDSAVLLCYSLEADPIATCRFLDLFQPPPDGEDADDDGSNFFGLHPDNMPHSMGSMVRMGAAQGTKVMMGVVGQLGQLVGSVGIGGGGGDGEGSSRSRTGGGVLKVLKAPLKMFQGNKGSDRSPKDNDLRSRRSTDDPSGGAAGIASESDRRGQRLDDRSGSRERNMAAVPGTGAGGRGGGGGVGDVVGGSWREKLRNGARERSSEDGRDGSVARGGAGSRLGAGAGGRRPRSRFDRGAEDEGYEEDENDDSD